MNHPTNGLPLHADRPPLRVDEGGTLRVGNSRVSLDLIVEQYESGMTPEEMAYACDTLVLSDVYAVIAYYLQHQEEVDVYLKLRAEQAQSQREAIESGNPRVSRTKLLARRNASEQGNAPTRQVTPTCTAIFSADSTVARQTST